MTISCFHYFALKTNHIYMNVLVRTNEQIRDNKALQVTWGTLIAASVIAMVQPSLADELGHLMDRGDNVMPESLHIALGGQTRPLFILKCHSYLRGKSYTVLYLLNISVWSEQERRVAMSSKSIAMLIEWRWQNKCVVEYVMIARECCNTIRRLVFFLYTSVRTCSPSTTNNRASRYTVVCSPSPPLPFSNTFLLILLNGKWNLIR